MANDYGYVETPLDTFAESTAVRANGCGLQFFSAQTLTGSQGVGLNYVIAKEGDSMAFENDFDGGKIIKTARDNDVKVQIVDGASGAEATKKLSIVEEGEAIVAAGNDSGVFAMVKDAAGNADIAEKGAGGGIKVEIVDADGHEFAISETGGLKIEATDLDIRDLSHASDSVKVGDGTDFLAISGDGEASARLGKVQGTDGATAPAESLQVAGKDGSGNLQALSVDSAGRLQVVPVQTGITDVCAFAASAVLGVHAVVTHDYVVPNGQKFQGSTVLVGARGQAFVRVGTYNGTTFTPKFAWFQDPKENLDHSIAKLSLVGDGVSVVRVEITNADASSSQVYSTLQGALS